MKIKICGLTDPRETIFLNEAGADYAGFVFYEKSKRNITIAQAEVIREKLNSEIKRVAVTVAPTADFVKTIEESGFDILQVHKSLDPKLLEMIHIPVWFAINIADEMQLREKTRFLDSLPERLGNKITAIVVDGAGYGGGDPFDWEKNNEIRKMPAFAKRKFILAGGLNEANVMEGIRRFQPDIVDVSSGVEGANGKDQDKINAFIRKVRDYE